MIACPCAVCHSADSRDRRLRSSILVQSPTTTLVVDTTPDFRYQMLRADVKVLDAVLYTHPHKDHIAGMDDVRAYNYFLKRPMNIYANEMTQLSIVREFPYAFSETKYPGVPEIVINPIDQENFTIGDIEVGIITVWHMRMPVLGFRFGSFTYITDANRIEPAEMDKIRGSSHLVLNALRREKHISHFTLGEAIQVADELQVPNVYFTHISHQLGLHAEVEAGLPPDRHLAYDGLQLLIA